VAVSYAIADFATYAMLSDIANLHTRAGRHLLAGALALATLAVVEMAVALLRFDGLRRWPWPNSLSSEEGKETEGTQQHWVAGLLY
jgi:hypothetical protein